MEPAGRDAVEALLPAAAADWAASNWLNEFKELDIEAQDLRLDVSRLAGWSRLQPDEDVTI